MSDAGKTPGQHVDEAIRAARDAAAYAAREARRAARDAGDGSRTPGAYVNVAYHTAKKTAYKAAQDVRDRSRHAKASTSPEWVVFDPDATESERKYALWIHAGAGLAWVATYLSGGFVFIAPILVSLVMWQSRRHDSPFIDDHGREALNFQISLFPVAIMLTLLTCGLGLLLVPVLTIGSGVVALRAANRGEYFRYPMCIRFIKPPQEQKA